MLIQLPVLALFFFILAGWFFKKKKHVLGITFSLIGLAALALFFIVRWMYPHRSPI